MIGGLISSISFILAVKIRKSGSNSDFIQNLTFGIKHKKNKKKIKIKKVTVLFL